jgi:hypothetical protein
LQRVFEAYCSLPPVKHDRDVRQRLALQPPQPGVAVAQHRRRRIRRHAGHCERLLESAGYNRWAVARESEAGRVSFSVDYFARDHLKTAFVLAAPAADVAAIKPNKDGFGWLHCGRLCRFRGVRQHNGSPIRMVLFRTVHAFSAPLTGSSSDSRSATLPNGASAAYRAVT